MVCNARRPLVAHVFRPADGRRAALKGCATCLLVFVLDVVSVLHAQVLTSQYDNARTGTTLTETTLTPANVNVERFGKIFSWKVDGDVYAQPLYAPRVTIPGKGIHDVVFIATEHDSVYAFDAAGQPREPLWHVNLLKPGETTVPAADVRCPFIAPEVGITPTPAIDAATGTIYVLARSKTQGAAGPRYVQRLHALAIATGADKAGSPADIDASVKGTGAGSVDGRVPFDPLRELARAGLLLDGGQVYLTWGSSCDVGPYHGWVMAYDARTLRQTAVLNTSPDAAESGIWQSDMAPAADGRGHVYVATGNGVFDAASGGRNYGDTLLKLRGSDLSVVDAFTPSNQAELNARDWDLGSGGPILLPEHSGKRLLLIAGKRAPLHVLNANNLKVGALQSMSIGGGAYAAAAFWHGHVFFAATNDSLQDFPAAGGALSDRPAASSQQRFINPGAGPVVSANGARDAIVWLIETKVWNDYASTKASILRAYDATNVARELFNSEENSARDRAGVTVRFTIPPVANGRVYIGTKGEVDVYGLLAPSR
jgi:hypothetical protein